MADLYSTPYKRYYQGPKTLRNAQATAALGRIGQSQVPLSSAMRALKQGVGPAQPFGMSGSSQSLDSPATTGPAIGVGVDTLDTAAKDALGGDGGGARIGGKGPNMDGAIANSRGAGHVSGPDQGAGQIGGSAKGKDAVADAMVGGHVSDVISDTLGRVGRGVLGFGKAALANPLEAVKASMVNAAPMIGVNIADHVVGGLIDGYNDRQDKANMDHALETSDLSTAKGIGTVTGAMVASNRNRSDPSYGEPASGKLGIGIAESVGLGRHGIVEGLQDAFMGLFDDSYEDSKTRGLVADANIAEPGTVNSIANPNWENLDPSMAVPASKKAAIEQEKANIAAARKTAREKAISELAGVAGSFGKGPRGGFGPQPGSGFSPGGQSAAPGGGVSVGVGARGNAGGDPGAGGPGGNAW